LFVTEWFGVPTTPIAIVDLPDPHAAPFESGALLLASMAGEESKLAEINLVHELVHGAFSSPRPWINEGLAHFAEAMYREQKQDGRTAALDFLGIHRSAFLEAEKDVAASPQKNPGQPLATTFDESYYRSKAAYVWWMLRDMIGDEALKAAIRKYRAEDDKDPKYVEQLIAAAAPKRDLGWFFDDWVYQDRGLPDFRVLAAHPWKNEKGTQIVTVTIENLGGAGAEVPFTVRFEGGEMAQRIEVRAKSTATTRVEVRGTATEVVVNDGSVPESDLRNNVFKISAP
jgi:aminopeptidase N